MCILRRNILTCCSWVHSLGSACATGTALSILGQETGNTVRDGEVEPDVERWLQILAYGQPLGLRLDSLPSIVTQ